MHVIYCDRCKHNTEQHSKLFWPKSGEREWREGDECPACGAELCAADSFDAIP